MDKQISVLIVDDNFEFGNQIKEFLENDENLIIAGVARDGIEAIEKIKEYEPDVVLLDVVMPHKDGIGVLEDVKNINTFNKRPTFIMLTAIGHDTFIRKAITLGAEYYMIKPFDFETLSMRIKEVYNESNRPLFSNYNKIEIPLILDDEDKNEYEYGQMDAVEIEVTKLMNELGIPAHMTGYAYIREGIIYSVKNSRSFISVTKDLYPQIAQKFDTSPAKVERAIRGAIQKAWTRIDDKKIKEHFSFSDSKSKSNKPTNSEFMATIADKVRIKLLKKR